MARLTTNEIRSLFLYKDGQLIWKSDRKHATAARAGTTAGTITGYIGDQRIRIRFKNRTYAAARLIWQYHFGAIPDGWVIDHIDHDPLNNKIENLRAVPYTDNYKNIRLSPKNKSGFNGVREHSPGRWRAVIMVNRKLVYLGTFDTFDEARTARRAANDFYGFHSNHGKNIVAA